MFATFIIVFYCAHKIFSSFNADRELLSVIREIAEIENVCLWNLSLFSNALIAIFKRKQ